MHNYIKAKKTNLFWETLNWRNYCKYLFRCNKDKFLKSLREDLNSDNVFLTSSGRAGIMLSLWASGIGRNDEILIPQFLSPCVIDSVVRVGVPALSISEKTKAVLLYHHWGYPQNFEAVKEVISGRNLTIVEDCAHGFWGKNNGNHIGEFGDTAILSLSKIFRMTYAGAIKVNNDRLHDDITKELTKDVSIREYMEHIKGEWVYVNHYSGDFQTMQSESKMVKLNKWYSTLLLYPACKGIRGEIPRDHEEMKQIYREQNNKFLYLLDNLKDSSFIMSGDSVEEMAPLCYPLLNDDELTLRLVDEWLKERGVFTGIYHFDINRNMFNPCYRKCVPIPLYSSIEMELLKSFVKFYSGMSSA